MNSLNLNLKKQITQDWLNFFPEMSFFKPMWLIKRNGPLLIGVCLESVLGNTAYRPVLHIHNLCRPTGFISLTLWNPIQNKRNTNYQTINIKSHTYSFEEAAKSLRQQSLFPISEKTSLSEILTAYQKYLRLNMPSSKYPIFIYEDIISLLTWCGKRKEAEKKFNDFVKIMSNWMPIVFENVGGYNTFCNKLYDIIDTPHKLQEIYDSEIMLLKANKLPDLGFTCN